MVLRAEDAHIAQRCRSKALEVMVGPAVLVVHKDRCAGPDSNNILCHETLPDQ